MPRSNCRWRKGRLCRCERGTDEKLPRVLEVEVEMEVLVLVEVLMVMMMLMMMHPLDLTWQPQSLTLPPR
jgi:hypothetical protein